MRAARGGQQTIDIGDRKDFGQAPPALGSLQNGGRIVAALSLRVQEAMHLADGGQFSCDRRRLQSVRAELCEIGADVLGVGFGNDALARGEMRGIIIEVARIGGERVVACAALRGQHVEK